MGGSHLLEVSMPTRSTTLGVANVPASTPLTFGTVPAGETWIVKSILLIDQGGLGGHAYVWFSRSPGSILGVFGFFDLSLQPVAEWEGWVVGRPGDVLQCFPDTTNVHV